MDTTSRNTFGATIAYDGVAPAATTASAPSTTAIRPLFAVAAPGVNAVAPARIWVSA